MRAHGVVRLVSATPVGGLPTLASFSGVADACILARSLAPQGFNTGATTLRTDR